MASSQYSSFSILAASLTEILFEPDPTSGQFAKFIDDLDTYLRDHNAEDVVVGLKDVFAGQADLTDVKQVQIFMIILCHINKTVSISLILDQWLDALLLPILSQSDDSMSTVIQQTRGLMLKGLIDLVDPNQAFLETFRARILEIYISTIDRELKLCSHDQAHGEEDDLGQELLPDKFNLEQVILAFFGSNTKGFMEHTCSAFKNHAWRLPLLTLLDRCVDSSPSQSSVQCILASSWFRNLLELLVKDQDILLFSLGLSILTRLLPSLVTDLPEKLLECIPPCFLILYRAFCSWPNQSLQNQVEINFVESERSSSGHLDHSLTTREFMIETSQLENTGMTSSTTPDPRTVHNSRNGASTDIYCRDDYFALLLGLFPCNTLLFLRASHRYLTLFNAKGIKTENWGESIDQFHLQKAFMETILPRFRIPSNILLFSEDVCLDELRQCDRFRGQSASTLILTCQRLYLHDLMASETSRHSSRPPPRAVPSEDVFLSPNPIRSPDELGATISQMQLPPFSDKSTQSLTGDIKFGHLRGLQRENLLLKSELNFELWLKREGLKHIDKLFQQNVLRQVESEAELLKRQATLAKYRRRYSEIQTELKTQKTQASRSIQEYKSWNKQQEDKLSELRKRERLLTKEASRLHDEINLRAAEVVALTDLRDQAKTKIFDLTTKFKEVEPKIGRLRDYEAKIDQLTKLQQLWDNDIERYNQQANQMDVLISDYRKMELRLQNMEAVNKELEKKSVEQLHHPVVVNQPNVVQTSEQFVRDLIAKVRLLEAENEGLRRKVRVSNSL